MVVYRNLEFVVIGLGTRQWISGDAWEFIVCSIIRAFIQHLRSIACLLSELDGLRRRLNI